MPRKKPPQRMPWDIADGEPNICYAAFVTFRDLGPRRSLAAAYRLGMNKPDAGNAAGTWNRWCLRWQWHDRVTAYDNYLDQKKVKAAVIEKQKLARKEVREIEISARATLLDTAGLAHSDIADVVQWNDEGDVTVTPSDQLPQHVTKAISRIKKTYDKDGRPVIEVEMHPKVRPLDLLGQNQGLWDSDKKQQEKVATGTFLELLQAMKSGQFQNMFPPSMLSINNPPAGVVIETEAALIPAQADVEKLKEEL